MLGLCWPHFGDLSGPRQTMSGSSKARAPLARPAPTERCGRILLPCLSWAMLGQVEPFCGHAEAMLGHVEALCWLSFGEMLARSRTKLQVVFLKAMLAPSWGQVRPSRCHVGLLGTNFGHLGAMMMLRGPHHEKPSQTIPPKRSPPWPSRCNRINFKTIPETKPPSKR